MTRTPDPYVPNVVRYQLRYFSDSLRSPRLFAGANFLDSSKAAAKVLLFFDIRKFFCIFFAKSAILYVKKQILCLYREPGSNRHAHHWAKDFKSFLSTYSNIAACFCSKATKVTFFSSVTLSIKSGCKITAFF